MYAIRSSYVITVCLGTACHVKGGNRLVDHVSRILEIEPGSTYTLRLTSTPAVSAALSNVTFEFYPGRITSYNVCYTKLLRSFKLQASSFKLQAEAKNTPPGGGVGFTFDCG